MASTRGADLREPVKASISRKRKIHRNEVRKKSDRDKNDPKVSAYQWVKENKNEFLTVTDNMLRCDTCEVTIS